jgi:hypothetical protein
VVTNQTGARSSHNSQTSIFNGNEVEPHLASLRIGQSPRGSSSFATGAGLHPTRHESNCFIRLSDLGVREARSLIVGLYSARNSVRRRTEYEGLLYG